MSLRELKGLLERLEGVQVPKEFRSDAKENDVEQRTSNQSLIESYKQARDEYLKRRVKLALIQNLKSYNGTSFEKPAEAPSEDELEELRQERDRKLAEVQEKGKLINHKKVEIQAKYSIFLSRRQLYKEMLQEYESTKSDDGNDNFDGNGIQINDAELERQKVQLAQLRTRREELEIQLRTVKQENMEIQRSLQEKSEEVAKIQSEKSSDYDISEESLRKIEDLNSEAKAKLTQIIEAKDMYIHLRGILEELFGVRILSFEPEAQSNVEATMYVTIEILKKHEIKIGIKQCANRSNDSSLASVKVCMVKLLTNATIKGPILKENGEPTVQLDIPDLSDLVRIAENRPWQGDNLGFVVREAMARCSMIEKRVEMLSSLQEIVLTKIGRLYESDATNSFGGENQEVVCSLNDEQVTVLLRLTPDCPFVKGSVYIDQLVGLGGWDNDELEKVKSNINGIGFKNPVALINSLRDEIQTRQVQGLNIPKTPKLPTRQNFADS